MEYKCSICLGTLFSVNTDVSVIQCGHMYHKTCLEGSMQTECPNCKTGITNTVEKVYPDVYDELVYNGSSNETETFLEEIDDCKKEKRAIMLNIIKRLDKENAHLKETNKSNQKNIETCKVFIKSFQKDNKDWETNCRRLQSENINLIAEIKKLTINTELNVVSEELHLKQINKISSSGIGSCIESIFSKGLLFYFFLKK